jgi:DNA-binding NtrC family response regulator
MSPSRISVVEDEAFTALGIKQRLAGLDSQLLGRAATQARPQLRILLVGRSPRFAEVIRPVLSGLLPDFEFQAIPEYLDSVKEMEQGGIAASLVDVQEPQDEARVAELLQALQVWHLSVPVFVITPEPNVFQRLRLFELGALDCLSWPVDVSRLAALIDVLSVRRRCELSRSSTRAAAAPTPAEHVVAGFAFVSRALRELYDHIEAAADSESSLLLTGETGTGKSHVAKAIHDLSPRRKKPFVVVACGGLSPTLLESELFGHVRGSFTGADHERVGKFAMVEDGTILLDEIDCVPLEAQAKLLRVF